MMIREKRFGGGKLWRLSGLALICAPVLQVAAGGGAISGTVTNAANGAAVPGATVIIRRGADPTVPAVPVRTDDRGRYRSPELAPGEYSVEAGPPPSSRELITLLYAGRPCSYVGCPLAEGVKVQVTAARETTSIDFALPVGGSVSGTISDKVTGEPLSYVRVMAVSGSFRAPAVSGPDGRYRIDALVTGVYTVEARPAWEGVLGAGLEHARRLEQMLSVERSVTIAAPAAVASIDFALGYGGRIRGTVTHARTGVPVAGASIQVNGSHSASATTDAKGQYEVTGLPTGNYTVFVLMTDAGTGLRSLPLADQVYKNVPCEARSCWNAKGTPVRVTAPQTTAKVDFALEPVGDPRVRSPVRSPREQ